MRASLIDVPPINGVIHLAEQIRISPSLLYAVAFNPRYITHRLRKKAGGYRTILIPPEPLRAVQRWVLRNVLDQVPVDLHASAYVRNRLTPPTLANAHPHVGNDYLMCLDFKDFFPSIDANRVRRVYYDLGYRGKGLHLLTALCTLHGNLPVGAPTSPALSNLVCRPLDKRIANYVRRFDVTYTRYADDLTFSANFPRTLDRVLPMIRRIISEEGFRENPAKYRRMGPARKRVVTGLVITNDACGIGVKRYRILRSRIWNNKGATDSYLEGMKAWLKTVDPDRYNALIRYEDEVRLHF